MIETPNELAWLIAPILTWVLRRKCKSVCKHCVRVFRFFGFSFIEISEETVADNG